MLVPGVAVRVGEVSVLFTDLKDSTGKIQLYLQKKVLSDEAFDQFKRFVDLGDMSADADAVLVF